MVIIGGGAIGTEMAQAFSRLGSRITVVHMDPHLVPIGDTEAGHLLQERFEKEGITVRNGARIEKISYENGTVSVHAGGEVFSAQRLLMAAGRMPVLKPLNLEKAGVAYTKKGITVDDFMRTNVKNIYAAGDCNGQALLSHAAMHQGMLALMHSLSPLKLGMFRRSRYVVPWAVFTQPEVAQVGLTEKQAREKGGFFEVVKKEFLSYGRTVADGHPEGFVKVILGKRGRILGATVVGENASELIQEWTLAMQYKKNIFSILMTQHAFPSISMINKMVAEQWMMGKMQSSFLRKLIRFFAR
jgi:pyruvate/2-oxoglutarate dehydrogenase complex dihydrolipoamide dehydrogenase (E3) component